jgi:hypothetical protein
MKAGQSALTRISGASERASASVRLFKAAFDAAYAIELPVPFKADTDENIDDAAAAGVPKMRSCRADHLVRADYRDAGGCLKVQRIKSVKIIVRHELCIRGVVHERIETTPSGHNFATDLPAIEIRCNITPHRQNIAARQMQSAFDSLGLVGIVQEAHCRPISSGGKTLTDRRAEISSTTGYQHDGPITVILDRLRSARVLSDHQSDRSDRAAPANRQTRRCWRPV